MSEVACNILLFVLGASLTFNALVVAFLVSESRRWKQQRAREIEDWDRRNQFIPATNKV